MYSLEYDNKDKDFHGSQACMVGKNIEPDVIFSASTVVTRIYSDKSKLLNQEKYLSSLFEL